MVLPGRELLSGAVEVDECYIGARRQGSGGRGAVGKAIVVIAVEERGQAPGRVRMRRVPNVTKDTLTDFVLDHIARHSEVRTDGWQGYFDIGSPLRYPGSALALVMRPHVHLVSSLVKRWILATHQGAVSLHQLGYYLDEFTFRFNRRHSRHRGLLFC
jgi:transposase-like protein